MPETYQSSFINAPVEIVWKTIRDFHDMSWAPNVIVSLEVLGDIPGTEVGSRRILNGAFHETLTAMNPESYHISYSIDEGPEPLSPAQVSNYTGEIRLTPVTLQNGTMIEWSSRWESDDSEAVSFCHNIYAALLRDLAETLES